MSEDLLAKIRQAVKLRNEALAAFETSRETLASRAKKLACSSSKPARVRP
jgi:hypothetical protein